MKEHIQTKHGEKLYKILMEENIKVHNVIITIRYIKTGAKRYKDYEKPKKKNNRYANAYRINEQIRQENCQLCQWGKMPLPWHLIKGEYSLNVLYACKMIKTKPVVRNYNLVSTIRHKYGCTKSALSLKEGYWSKKLILSISMIKILKGIVKFVINNYTLKCPCGCAIQPQFQNMS